MGNVLGCCGTQPIHPTTSAAGNVEADIQITEAAGPGLSSSDVDAIIDSPAPIPACNQERLLTLHALRMSTNLKGPMEHVDHIINMVMTTFQVPSAWITALGDEESCVRNCAGDMQPGTFPWAPTLCGWTLASPIPTVLAIPDTLLDARFTRTFLTVKMGVRSYCGAPLVASNSHRLGTLCMVDTKPRNWTTDQCQILANFAELAVRAIERAGLATAAEYKLQPELHFALRSIESLEASILVVDLTKPDISVVYANPAAAQLLGSTTELLRQQSLLRLLQGDSAMQEQWRTQAAANKRWQQEGLVHSSSTTTIKLDLTFSPVDSEPLDPSAPGPVAPIRVSRHSSSGGAPARTGLYFVSLVDSEKLPGLAAAAPPGEGSTPGRVTEGVPWRSTTQDAVGGDDLLDVLQLGPAIASGSYGRVFLGKYHGAKVAIKVLDTVLKKDEETGLSLEVLLSQQLKHPNVVTTLAWTTVTGQRCLPRVHTRHGFTLGTRTSFKSKASFKTKPSFRQSGDAPADDKQTWLVLEYCNSGCLMDAIDAGSFKAARLPNASISLMAVVTTAYEIAAGMNHLHKQGIVHGDLSPYNVLLSSNGSQAAAADRGFFAKVADFGLARSLGEGEELQTATYGTISHMPPELLEDHVLSKAADVYSFGVLLWQMYTGLRPWAGLGPAAVVKEVVINKSRLPLPESMPQGLASLVTACCSHDPAQRPTFDDVLEVLRPIMDIAELQANANPDEHEALDPALPPGQVPASDPLSLITAAEAGPAA